MRKSRERVNKKKIVVSVGFIRFNLPRNHITRQMDLRIQENNVLKNLNEIK